MKNTGYALNISRCELVALDAVCQTVYGEHSDPVLRGSMRGDSLNKAVNKIANLEDWEMKALLFGIIYAITTKIDYEENDTDDILAEKIINKLVDLFDIGEDSEILKFIEESKEKIIEAVKE
jgi:hypothetical protein